MMREKTSETTLPEPEIEYEEQAIFGLMAEFEEHEELLAAARRAYSDGYRRMDAYSPFPIDGLAEALGHESSPIPLFTLAGGIIGGLGAYFMEWIAMAKLYPINIGGRPLNSWPNFIPVTFETTVLGAALTAFIGMWALNRLPQPYHPVFNVEAFARASTDRFFLVIETTDPRFERYATWKFLEGLHPVGVSEVAP